MADYYEINILCTGESSPGEYSIFDEKTKIFDKVEDAAKWLKETYAFVKKRTTLYDGDIKTPCGYVYHFENSDLSHSPVEKWNQRDWVHVAKIHAEFVFKEIAYDMPE